VTASAEFINPADAARRLGVSVKALRLYEQCGLVTPVRTEAGWRAYGPQQMAGAGEIAALRALGLSLAQVARVLGGDAQDLEPALAAHQASLEGEARRVADAIDKVRGLRAELANGRPPRVAELARLVRPAAEPVAAFALPWPWGGETFELRDIRPLTYIIGPLGSGKTRFAQRLAEALADAAFLPMERADNGAAEARARLDTDPALGARVDEALAWIAGEGAAESDALLVLLAGLLADGPAMLVVDMVEQGLDQGAQEALMAYLRRRGPGARPLFLMTRSSAILDLTAVGPDEAIILCPANHSPPERVAPYPGAPGYEAVATCLASPDVRARTEGMIAFRPPAA